jgi:protein-S-isoprenylcysteine O-methyltransferase Ste14
VRTLFGAESDRWYRLVYNGVAVVSLIPVLLLLAFLPDLSLYSIPYPWAYINLAIQGVAGMVLVVGVWQTGAWSFLGIEQFLHPRRKKVPLLEVRGLYRWVRHPLYTAGLVVIWFTPVMTLNIFALNLGLTIYLVIGAIIEERKLVHEFGAAYEEYRKRTPMLIPDFPQGDGGKD